MDYAKNLPLEIKIKILAYLPYKDVMFITNHYFWQCFWDNNRHTKGKFQLNQEQEYVLEVIKSGKNIFINAPAGTGKSTVIKYFYQTTKNINIGLTSTTGISALNIGGVTLHSFLGIGLGFGDVNCLYRKISNNTSKYNIWKSLDMLIIDEISMLSPALFDKLENVARKIRGNDHTFGGIQLIVLGDLFQLPCIGSSCLIVDSLIFKKCFHTTIELRNIIRQDDRLFKNVLNKIRVGNVDTQVKNILTSRIFKFNKQDQIQPTKLFCIKKEVCALNEKELDKLSISGRVFNEYDMKFSNPNNKYCCENFIKNSTTPENLQICIGAQVMLTVNISRHLANGSRGVVVGFDELQYPIVKFYFGERIITPHIFDIFSPNLQGKMIKVGSATQIPLKIAYALTIHSCQGSTLDCVEVDLKEAFEYGQAYTALSRVRRLDGLYLKKFDFNVIKPHPSAVRHQFL